MFNPHRFVIVIALFCPLAGCDGKRQAAEPVAPIPQEPDSDEVRAAQPMVEEKPLTLGKEPFRVENQFSIAAPEGAAWEQTKSDTGKGFAYQVYAWKTPDKKMILSVVAHQYQGAPDRANIPRGHYFAGITPFISGGGAIVNMQDSEETEQRPMPDVVNYGFDAEFQDATPFLFRGRTVFTGERRVYLLEAVAQTPERLAELVKVLDTFKVEGTDAAEQSEPKK